MAWITVHLCQNVRVKGLLDKNYFHEMLSIYLVPFPFYLIAVRSRDGPDSLI